MRCNICNQRLGRITATHLLHRHGMSLLEFRARFPGVKIGNMPWVQGDTKETNPSLLKLSRTLKKRRVWNYSAWQEKKRSFPLEYRKLAKNGNLAELIGMVLGDGNLYKHPRTENLRITCNSKEASYIKHVGDLVSTVFFKHPSVRKRNDENAVSVDLYQGKISERLGLSCGNKIKNNAGIPSWVYLKRRYIIRCLKGLFETDGCLHEDKGNYTRCIEFKNNCSRLREDVHRGLIMLGFSPQCGSNYVRLARKKEVYSFRDLIGFRNYAAL